MYVSSIFNGAKALVIRQKIYFNKKNHYNLVVKFEQQNCCGKILPTQNSGGVGG